MIAWLNAHPHVESAIYFVLFIAGIAALVCWIGRATPVQEEDESKDPKNWGV